MALKVNGRTRMIREIYRSNLKPILKKQYNISEKVAVEAKLRLSANNMALKKKLTVSSNKREKNMNWIFFGR